MGFQRKLVPLGEIIGGDLMVKNENSGQPEKKPEEIKIFKAKSMVDGDLRMPKSLRVKITWLKNHTDVNFEILKLNNSSITLKISKST